MLKITFFLGLLSLSLHAAYAGEFEDGMAAFEARKYEQAHELWLPLAKKGNIDSQLNIGEMYAKGLGTKQDIELALMWYKKAVAQGSNHAEYKLGEIYRSGNGLPVNFKESIKWFRNAAEGGNAQAQYKLGVSYFKGEGVFTDYVTAYAWMDVSIKQGLDSATEFRDTIGGILNPSDLKKAKMLANEIFIKINHDKKN